MMMKIQADTLSKLSEGFTPHQPIHLPEFLAGRQDVLYRVTDAVNTEGLHVILFGERGTGKTSIARVLARQLEGTAKDGRRAILVSSSASDDYASLWQKVTQEILIAQQQLGFVQHKVAIITGRMDSVGALGNPNDVRLFLQSLNNPTVIIIDEFDRTPNNDARKLMADTIKLLSDSLVHSKLLLVGVGDNIDELMSEHQSISRNIAQIRVEAMTVQEMAQIIQKGYAYANLAYEPGLDITIARLSQGYPHYAHLLGLWAGRRAGEADHNMVTQADLDAAIPDALKNAEGGLQHQYNNAVLSVKRNAMFREVLLACALVEKDELGRFGVRAVAAPLKRITGKDYVTGAYQGHLAKFCDQDRGPVLKRFFKRHSYRWKFINPQIIPYIVLQGINAGFLSRSEFSHPI